MHRCPFETNLAREVCSKRDCNVGLLAYSRLAGRSLCFSLRDSTPPPPPPSLLFECKYREVTGLTSLVPCPEHFSASHLPGCMPKENKISAALRPSMMGLRKKTSSCYLCDSHLFTVYEKVFFVKKSKRHCSFSTLYLFFFVPLFLDLKSDRKAR